jgi:hypothetical protein
VLGGSGKNIRRHFRLTANGKRLIVADDRFKFIRRQAQFNIDIEAGNGAQFGDTVFGEGIADQHFRHGTLLKNQKS